MCGEVELRTSGAPMRVTICHCRWCQRRTGTAFGTEVVFREDQVELNGSALSRHRHVSDQSGRWLEVRFCSVCGTNLGFTLEAAPGISTVPAGAFDDPTWISQESVQFCHVFTRSRRAWGELSPTVEVYEEHFRA